MNSIALDTKLTSYTANAALAAAKLAPKSADKARAQAQDFETLFVNSMFQHMFTGIDGDGPFGNSMGVGPWRSFLTEQYAKSFVQKGGIGLADDIYRSLIAQQAARTK